MASTFSVRRYEPSDADRVWEVHEQAFTASPLEFVEDAEVDSDVRNVSAEYLAGDGEFLVGEVDGRIVAIGGFQPWDGSTVEHSSTSPRSHAHEDTVEIRRMRVHPEYQREGFGQRLLAELETRARERGFETAVLETNERLRAAWTLYEKNGYAEIGRETIPVTGDDLIRYRKEL